MKAERHGAIVGGKLREFLTNLAAILAPLSVTRATKEQIHQLARAIIDHGRMVSEFYSQQTVGVEERELAFRFRETTHNIVSALILLEKDGRASRTRFAVYWTLRLQHQNNTQEVSTSHEDQPRI